LTKVPFRSGKQNAFENASSQGIPFNGKQALLNGQHTANFYPILALKRVFIISGLETEKPNKYR